MNVESIMRSSSINGSHSSDHAHLRQAPGHDRCTSGSQGMDGADDRRIFAIECEYKLELIQDAVRR